MTAAILAHVGALGLFAWLVLSDRSAAEDEATPATSAPASASAASAAPAPAPTSSALLDLDVQPPAQPAPIAHDPGDQAGARAADRGDGAGSGQAAWTGRHDRPDDALLRHEPWNGGEAYR